MSYSLWIVSDKNDIGKLSSIYEMSEEEALGILVEDKRLIDAGEDLLDKFPMLEDLDDDANDDSPWATSPYITPYWIALAISFSKVEIFFSQAGPIFEKHGLVAYDPQDGVVYR